MSSSWDSLYSNLIKTFPYKTLMVIPPALSLVMVGILLTSGLEMGLEFRGGTWIEVLTDRDFSDAQLEQVNAMLSGVGLTDVESVVGWDVDTGKNKLTVTTTTVLNDSGKIKVKEILTPLAGGLTEFDTLSAPFSGKLPVGLEEKLDSHLGRRVDVVLEGGVLKVMSLDLDSQETERVLEYYVDGELDGEFQVKNFNSKTVGATLGETFRRQAKIAVVVAFTLMALVIFIAFHDLIPSFAVMLAAACDMALTAGAMSILGIPLTPASLAALLMLIGYSVDSDILLTVRVIKHGKGEIDKRIDESMKTGLTMTGTTLGVMVVIYIVSTWLTQIETLENIASVLLLGLFGDLFTTYFTNAGILKWYLEKNPAKARGARR